MIKLANIHSPFKNLKVKEMVPCCCVDCKPGATPNFYEYSALIKYRDKGIKETPCNVNAELASVEEMLSGFERSRDEIKNEILFMLREIKEKVDSRESFIEATNKAIMIKPDLFGVGVDLNAIRDSFAKKWFKKK